MSTKDSRRYKVEVIYRYGMEWRRYPDSPRRSDRSYYHNSKGQLLHRYIWEMAHGPLPKGRGHYVHHIDGDVNNNNITNLELVTVAEHMRIHHKGRKPTPEQLAHLERIRDLASAWHGSEDGRAWHRQHAEEVVQNIRARPKEEKVCMHCHRSYKVRYCGKAKDKYCSLNCRVAARYKSGVDDEVRRCAHCSRQFTINKYTHIKYCSRACSVDNKRLPHRRLIGPGGEALVPVEKVKRRLVWEAAVEVLQEMGKNRLVYGNYELFDLVYERARLQNIEGPKAKIRRAHRVITNLTRLPGILTCGFVLLPAGKRRCWVRCFSLPA